MKVKYRTLEDILNDTYNKKKKEADMWSVKTITKFPDQTPKKLNKEILDGIPIEEIERYLRKKKLEKLGK